MTLGFRLAAASILAGLAWCPPASAQRSDSVKELMGKAQSDSERRAVEDLINKLQGRARQAQPAPTPPAVAPAAKAEPEKPALTPALPAAAATPTAAASADVGGTPPAAAVEPQPASKPGVPAPTVQPVLAPTSIGAPKPPASEAEAAPRPTRPQPAVAIEPKAGPAAPISKVETPVKPPAASAAAAPTPKSPAVAPTAKAAAAEVTAKAPVTSATAAQPAAKGKQPPAAKAADAGVGVAPAIAAAKSLPTVELEIYFDFASAHVSPRAMATLVTLGRTLADPRLADQTFVIGGYTDGKGKPDYNQWLSQLRADTVKNVLVSEFKIDPKRLIAKGFGKASLKNAANPLANENRRVQIINWTNQMSR